AAAEADLDLGLARLEPAADDGDLITAAGDPLGGLDFIHPQGALLFTGTHEAEDKDRGGQLHDTVHQRASHETATISLGKWTVNELHARSAPTAPGHGRAPACC